MIELRYRGWFQCRLATDPDPYDEPRGVSGYVHAYAGEPDLDRVIRFQSPPFERPHGPVVGVSVDEVLVDGVPVPDHELVRAHVDLVGDAVFEGRNGAVADDGLEPIWPFVLRVGADGSWFQRSIVPVRGDDPFGGLLASGVQAAPEEVRDATGVSDLTKVWHDRAGALAVDEASAEEPRRTGLSERLQFLREDGGLPIEKSTRRFFFAKMSYRYVLDSAVDAAEPGGVQLLERCGIDDAPSWPTSFWMGGWDADTLCGYVRGVLRLPTRGGADIGPEVGITDRRP